ncbi:hypothetical protein SAMN05421857_1816 [Chryseobacterium formosense]|nr:hypothetical protein SAMN05421857_1816 [Chryseobacterium formosense]
MSYGIASFTISFFLIKISSAKLCTFAYQKLVVNKRLVVTFGLVKK